MNIIGPDALVFGVDDIAACETFLIDYGLEPKGNGLFAALDGTGVIITDKDNPELPEALPTGSMLRKTIYGVADTAALRAIKGELSKDREVKELADGSLESVDDMGFAIGFQITARKPLVLKAELVNAPGDTHRPVNEVGAVKGHVPKPRTLSHVVYFVPDYKKMEAFYEERLGFKVTDRFTEAGSFLRPSGTTDHHTLFMIQTPEHMKGCEHFAFHMGGPSEVLSAGSAFVKKGYEPFWGPGRHLFGSNYFWYFKSPLGCVMEYDADMDTHDSSWQAREADFRADNSQIFLFQYRETWAPGGQ
jgi:catechol 2,3-dioxygenase-like lactoylglutathione lyase family enzyme